MNVLTSVVQRWERLGFVRKLILLIAVGSYLGYGLAGVWERTARSNRLEQDISVRGPALAGVLGQHPGFLEAVGKQDWKSATAFLEQALKLDAGLLYAALYDGTGKQLAQAVDASLSTDERTMLGELLRHQGSGMRVFHFMQRLPVTLGEGGSGVTLRLGASGAQARAVEASAQRHAWTGAMVGACTAGLLWAWRLRRRLERLRDALVELSAEGESDVEAGTLERLELAAAGLKESLQKRFLEVEGSVRNQVSAAGEIADYSAIQGESVARHAAAVTETGSTVAELRQTFQQAAEQAQAVIDLAKKSEESTLQGKQSVEESVAAMDQIRDQVLTIRKTFVDLVDRTNLIGSIVDAVADLTDQSNVLALNAAVEAAKAGEHGRGFAVVAREVRTLAERSKESTVQIRVVLGDIEKASKQAMGVIEEGTRRTQIGVELAERAGQAIAILDRAIMESSKAAQQIAASTRQQAEGVEHIWEAINNIDRATSETAQGLQRLETSARGLKEMSSGVIKSLRPSA
ncbi:MAG: methyl-accepting chemotaxis protein [Myxococcaceae bacterium]